MNNRKIIPCQSQIFIISGLIVRQFERTLQTRRIDSSLTDFKCKRCLPFGGEPF
uniref:Uncharacterized protein n=1 Tax=uncultured marine virus TaxID=186617 RepID=A0A0F7LAW1_9VIRU|nr:hypothetical protein [uncultured marine virus]